MSEYYSILEYALQKGYCCIGVEEFYLNLEEYTDDDKKYFINRHDIDTDPLTAERMFEIEKQLGVKSSFYFRLSTWDDLLIESVLNYGSEVGYHYEEIASYCKDEKIGKATIGDHMPKIQERFKRNVALLESQSGMKIKSIASHGDFINRKIGVANHELINEEVLKNCEIEFECYAPKLLKAYSVIISDTSYPLYFHPKHPIDAINDKNKIVYLLTHPRHWYSSWYYTSRENLVRFVEGIRYKSV